MMKSVLAAKHRSRSHNAVIRVYDEAGKVIETHEHKGDLSGNPYMIKLTANP